MGYDSDRIRRALKQAHVKPDCANVARMQRSLAAVGPNEKNKKFLEEKARADGRLNHLHAYNDPSRSIHNEAFRDPAEIARIKARNGQRARG